MIVQMNRLIKQVNGIKLCIVQYTHTTVSKRLRIDRCSYGRADSVLDSHTRGTGFRTCRVQELSTQPVED